MNFDERSAQRLIYREARLLDEARYETWLTLFTTEATYWVPGAYDDPAEGPSIVHDDRQRMEERVFRLTRTPAYSQLPASRTVHLLGNLEFLPQSETSATIKCAANISEMRNGDAHQVGLGTPRTLSARMEYEVVGDDGEMAIQSKTVWLLERKQPLYNLTFLV